MPGSRFHPPRLDRLGVGPRKSAWTFDTRAHSEAHDASILIYTSVTTLDTVAGTPIYLPMDFQILAITGSVAGTPVTNPLVWDVLLGGNTVFGATGDRVTIQAGALFGRGGTPTLQHLPADSKLQCQGVTLSSATGPMMIYFLLKRI